MNIFLSLLFFLISISLFLLEAWFHFSLSMVKQEHGFSGSAYFLLFSIAIVFGVFGSLSISCLGFLRGSLLKRFFYGGFCGLLFSVTFFGAEDFISANRLKSFEDARAFSGLKGHCGLSVGRGLIRFYREVLNPGLRQQLREYSLNNQCRNKHYAELVTQKRLSCPAGADAVHCGMYWMDAFADQGAWNSESRVFFLHQMMDQERQLAEKAQRDTFKNELFEYLLKDKALTEKSPPLLKQLGVEEQFSDDYLFEKQIEERDELRTTQMVLEAVKQRAAEGDSPADWLQTESFMILQKEISFELERLPELEKVIEALSKRKKISYNLGP